MISLTKRILPAKMKNKTVLYLTKDKSSAALKRAALDDYFGSGEIGVLPSGKPVILSPEGYFISVSHSGGVVALVISDTPVGLDIEEVREFDFSHLKERFLSEREKSEVKDAASFFNVWVKKEAEAKISGDGIFSMRGKDTSALFTSLSKEVSLLAGRDFSACIATFQPVSYIVKEL